MRLMFLGILPASLGKKIRGKPHKYPNWRNCADYIKERYVDDREYLIADAVHKPVEPVGRRTYAFIGEPELANQGEVSAIAQKQGEAPPSASVPKDVTVPTMLDLVNMVNAVAGDKQQRRNGRDQSENPRGGQKR